MLVIGLEEETGLDKGIFGKSVAGAIVFEGAEMLKMILEDGIPQLGEESSRERGREDGVAVDFPAHAAGMQDVENRGHVEVEWVGEVSVVNFAVRGAGVDEGPVRQGLTGHGAEPGVGN